MSDIDDVGIDRDSLVSSGWKRGTFVELKKFTNIIDELPPKLRLFCERNETVYLIPVLYDCALIEPSLEKEPWVQVILAIPCQADNNFKHAKNPRKIHLPIQVDGHESYIEITALSFFQVCRKKLLQESIPSPNIMWLGNAKNMLLDWIAERYRRATFPDSFGHRIDKKCQKALDSTWKDENFSKFCSGVYINLHTDDELPEGQVYKTDILIAVPEEVNLRQIRNNRIADKMVEKLKNAILLAKGIQVSSIDLMSEDQFTKKIERKFKRFSLEYFSYSSKHDSEDEPSPLPSEFIGSKSLKTSFF
ncbi:hypothetical protein AB6H26_20805 [Providencia hangzhouensis]|uniref:hypothetical protein n=1 Tax=Providencia TaxID=586 RepID=UPI0008FB4B02|nr:MULTISPECIES: hypothetical protein [Providencia]APC14000.1 hypothetical protein RB151_043790 [Providencia rettgeri]EKH6495438.1 hypothetical protein [Providencia rettgeri]ELR5052707.1 hypothetical protein [Providencia rettgeri]ELR5154056.1 hypothetical protein [Providencia rettgeri]ELR5180623.1 hypothetical protein [Providencia rettgeri]